MRSTPFAVRSDETGEDTEFKPPLFSGMCEWKESEAANGVAVRGKLHLDINPTRFLRHHPFPTAGHAGMQARELMEPPFHEATLDRTDNFFPLAGRLWQYITPVRWRGQVRRYIQEIEATFEADAARANLQQTVTVRRVDNDEARYSVGSVETYWEWLSVDPLKLVRDLAPLVQRYSRRTVRVRTYECEQDEMEQDLAIVSFEYSPGEKVKIYAKTNFRVRIEVTHRLNGTNRFQFPPEPNEEGGVTRSRRHTFGTLVGLMNFFDRLRVRAAEVVNDLMQFIAGQATIPTSHVSGYMLLATVARYVPEHRAAMFIISALVNNAGRVRATGIDQATRDGLRALERWHVLERINRNNFTVTPDYRHALQTIQTQANWPLITLASVHRRRRRAAP